MEVDPCRGYLGNWVEMEIIYFEAGMQPEDGQYSVLREKAVLFVYNDWEGFHPLVVFDIFQNNVWLHINTRGNYKIYVGELEWLCGNNGCS
jgi:hypothetical protein